MGNTHVTQILVFSAIFSSVRLMFSYLQDLLVPREISNYLLTILTSF